MMDTRKNRREFLIAASALAAGAGAAVASPADLAAQEGLFALSVPPALEESVLTLEEALRKWYIEAHPYVPYFVHEAIQARWQVLTVGLAAIDGREMRTLIAAGEVCASRVGHFIVLLETTLTGSSGGAVGEPLYDLVTPGAVALRFERALQQLAYGCHNWRPIVESQGAGLIRYTEPELQQCPTTLSPYTSNPWARLVLHNYGVCT